MLRSVVLVLCTTTWAFAQCPTVDFTIPASACKFADIAPQATVTNGVSYSWDFCDGSLANNPISITNATNALIAEPYDLRSFEENDNHYMLSVNYINGKVLRYDFGDSFSNPPVISDLGNFGVIIKPLGIELWKESNNLYALVVTESGSLFRLSFGNSIQNSPTVTQLAGVSGLNDHRHIRITRENGVVIALIAGGSTRNLSILNFGSSIVNNPTRTFISIPAASFMTGIDIGVECNIRYALVSSYGGGLFRLDFGTSFLNAPSVTSLTSIPDNLIWGLSLAKSAGNYHAFLFSDGAGIVRVDFGNSLSNPVPAKVNLGFFGGISLAIGLTISKSESTYYLASVNYTNGQFKVLEFPKDCTIGDSYSNDQNPSGVNYDGAGTYMVTLSAKGVNDENVSITKPITISNLDAPSLMISESGNCLANGVMFTGTQQSGVPLSSLNWDFGDGNMATGQNPVHMYASPGTYKATLEATAANSCVNRLEKNIPIYNAPVADFLIPVANPVCTNQSYTFTNTTIEDPGYSTTWEWRINGSLITTAEDLNYTFTNTSNQEIKLKASIPGCENETTKNISSLVDGPTPDFSFAGQCEDADIVFTNNSSGTITGYSWDFDDGQSSSDINPNHAFSTIGSFDVTLTASNAAGCNNVVSKQVIVYSEPQVSFAAALPPFSCNGTPTMFSDLTPNPVDSNIASWLWNFGDSGSGQNTSTLKNPQHTYSTAGNYDVSLTVSTNYLCSSTLQLPVTISQAPAADFNFTPPCEDMIVNFTDSSIGTIQSWNWQIGSTFYFIQNPSHTFSNPVSTNATLNVTATNGCISSITKPIIVPAKLVPDFSVLKNCTGQETIFTDITNPAADPITNRDWNFNNLGTGAGSPETFTFTTTGNKNVTLTLTTQTGCTYAVTKVVNIISSPQANFTASPEAGAPPLEVQFTNTSVGATSYLWNFNDSENTTSNQISPSFSYLELGGYVVDLTAFNAQNCSHTFSREINVVLPVVDVALIGLELMEFPDGSIKPAVTIFNHGNTPLNNLGLLVNVSGPVIREYVSTTILPGTSFRQVLEIDVPDPDQLDYLCIEADIEDISPQDNQACQNIEKTFITLPPYPNPTNGELHIDWILNEDGVVNISVINSMGQAVEDFSVNSSEGLNPITLETAGMSSGVYLIRLDYKSTTRVYRVFVAE